MRLYQRWLIVGAADLGAEMANLLQSERVSAGVPQARAVHVAPPLVGGEVEDDDDDLCVWVVTLQPRIVEDAAIGGIAGSPDVSASRSLAKKRRSYSSTPDSSRNDCKLGAETIDSCPVKRPEPSTERPQNICLDRAYDHDFIREELRERA